MQYILLLVSFFYCSSVMAFKLSPMTQSLKLTEKKRSALFYIENQDSLPQAIQISMTTRDMNTKGKETNRSVGDDFLIFPDQVILRPNQKKAIKVTYISDKELTKEMAYRFVAEQLPLDLLKKKKGQTTNIKILLKYRAAFYVEPSNVSHQLVVQSEKIKIEGDFLHFSIENKGKAHKVLVGYALVLKAKDSTVTFKDDQAKGVLGENILALSQRDFRLKIPKKLRGKNNIKVELVADK